MPEYSYRCSMKHLHWREFPFGQAKPTSRCPLCKNKASRVILSVPYMVMEKAFSDKRENRVVPVGHSQKDALEVARKAEKDYHLSYNGPSEQQQEAEAKAYSRIGEKAPEYMKPADLPKRKPMVEMAKEMGLLTK